MKKIILTCLGIIAGFCGYGQQIFSDGFEFLNNPQNTIGCPSISHTTNIDVFGAWSAFAGTPLVATEPCPNNGVTNCVGTTNNYILMWAQDFDNSGIIKEGVYIRNGVGGINLLRNTTYSLSFNIRVPAGNLPTDATFNVELDNYATLYYNGVGSCGSGFTSTGILLTGTGIPINNAIPTFTRQTIIFNTGNTPPNNIAFYPNTAIPTPPGGIARQALVHLDDVNIAVVTNCISNVPTQNIVLQNNSIIPNTAIVNNTLTAGQTIIGGRSVLGFPTPQGDYTVANRTLHLKAGNSLEFRNGFSVQAGANFSAMIECVFICTNCIVAPEPTEEVLSRQQGLIKKLDTPNLRDSTSTDSTSTLEKEYFSISPNPTSGKFTISGEKQDDYPAEIRVYSRYGKEVIYIQNTKGFNSLDFDLSNAERGLYLVRIRFGEAWFEKRLLVE